MGGKGILFQPATHTYLPEQCPDILLPQPGGSTEVHEEHTEAKTARCRENGGLRKFGHLLKNETTVLYSVVTMEWGPPWGQTEEERGGRGEKVGEMLTCKGLIKNSEGRIGEA